MEVIHTAVKKPKAAVKKASKKTPVTAKKKDKAKTKSKTTAKAKPTAARAKAKPAPKPAAKRGRTASGKVPKGRTLSTHDNYLPGKKTGSKKERPVVVIEANSRNELAVVPLSSRPGRNRSRLVKYLQGKSFFKHYIEIEDDEGKPIRVNQKFRENDVNLDVSEKDVEHIKDILFEHSKPMKSNREKIDKFRGK